MDPATIVAASATVIALLSLVVTIVQTRVTRMHNRKSVVPVLQFASTFHAGEPGGLMLSNVGLGPARIVTSRLRLGDRTLGEFGEDTVNQVRDTLDRRPRATTFRAGAIIPTGDRRFLLGVDEYDPESDAELRHLIRQRLTIELEYESLYGGEKFRAVHPGP